MNSRLTADRPKAPAPADALEQRDVRTPPLEGPRPHAPKEAPAGPAYGSVWEHRKGGRYIVFGTGHNEAHLSPVVIYQSLLGGTLWVRDLGEFVDGRFTEIK